MNKLLMYRQFFYCAILLVLGCAVFGDVYAQEAAQAQGTIKAVATLNKAIFNLLRAVAGLGMFSIAAWKFFEAYTQGQLPQKWVYFLGVVVFLIVLAKADTLYKTITGHDPFAGSTVDINLLD